MKRAHVEASNAWRVILSLLEVVMYMYILYVYRKKTLSWWARQASDPGQCCFEFVSSHQQGIPITCLAHYPAIHTQGQP